MNVEWRIGVYPFTNSIQILINSPRDITFSNIMMEAEGMFPEPYHFVDSSMNQQYTRTVRKPRSRAVSSPKYYIIDFGMSRQYSREEGPFFEPSIIAVGDCIIPEHTDPSILQDPFQADIYCMGNVMRQVMVVSYHVIKDYIYTE